MREAVFNPSLEKSPTVTKRESETTQAKSQPQQQIQPQPLNLDHMLLNGSVDVKNITVERTPVKDQLLEEAQQLTQEQLDELWQAAGEEFGISSLLAEAKPTLRNDGDIDLTVSNSLFENNFRAHKVQVLEKIRNEAHNRKININIVVDRKERSALVYSADEKYRLMQSTNPHLQKLRQLFPQIDY